MRRNISSGPFCSAFQAFFLCAVLSFARAGYAQGELLIELSGEPAPGALLVGQTYPDAVVSLEGKRLRVDQEGYFVFGFGRDDSGEKRLQIEHGERSEEWQLALAERSWDIQSIEGVPQETVTPPESRLQRIRAEAGQVYQARQQDSDLQGFRQSFRWPVEGRITGVFGSQRIFNGEPRRPHYGVDIAVPTGTPVLAPADGVVSLAHDDMFFSGGTLIIDHGLGVSTSYLHMSEIVVEDGERVAQGDEIGRVGATGRATGPHLCWRINWYQERLDPMTVVAPQDL